MMRRLLGRVAGLLLGSLLCLTLVVVEQHSAALDDPVAHWVEPTQALAFLPLGFTELADTARTLSQPTVTDDDAMPPPHTERLTMVSQATGRTTPYLVYLPPDYGWNRARRYPVLTMLHGIGGNDPTGAYWEWEELGLLATADRMIRDGEIQPLIIVLPQGEDGYWVDQADGGPQWGRFVARELVAEVDRQFRTQPERDRRAIGGLSMGGHGALQIAMNYPTVFGVVGAHSPTLHTHDTAPY